MSFNTKIDTPSPLKENVNSDKTVDFNSPKEKLKLNYISTNKKIEFTQPESANKNKRSGSHAHFDESINDEIVITPTVSKPGSAAFNQPITHSSHSPFEYCKVGLNYRPDLRLRSDLKKTIESSHPTPMLNVKSLTKDKDYSFTNFHSELLNRLKHPQEQYRRYA
jgi:hypothetical protein